MNHLLKKICCTSYLTFTTLIVASCSSDEAHQAQETLSCNPSCEKKRKAIIDKIVNYDLNGDISKFRSLKVLEAENSNDIGRKYRIRLDPSSVIPDIEIFTRAPAPRSKLEPLFRRGTTTLDRFGTTSVVTYPFIWKGCAHKVLFVIKDDTSKRSNHEFAHFIDHVVGSNCDLHEKEGHPIIDGIPKGHNSAHGSGTRE